MQKEKSKMGKLPLIMQRWCSWGFAFVSPLGAALTSSDRPRSTQHTELRGVILSETIRLVKCTELGYCPAKIKGLEKKIEFHLESCVMLLKYLDIALKKIIKITSAALLILMQNTAEGEFKRNGLNNKCPQLEKKKCRKNEGEDCISRSGTNK